MGDPGMMSTSVSMATLVKHMSSSKGLGSSEGYLGSSQGRDYVVVWELRPRAQDADGYHLGANISMVRWLPYNNVTGCFCVMLPCSP